MIIGYLRTKTISNVFEKRFKNRLIVVFDSIFGFGPNSIDWGSLFFFTWASLLIWGIGNCDFHTLLCWHTFAGKLQAFTSHANVSDTHLSLIWDIKRLFFKLLVLRKKERKKNKYYAHHNGHHIFRFSIQWNSF